MKTLRRLALLAALAAGSGTAQAQIQLDLSLDRTVFVAHEPITGTLTIVNRAGQDLIFGDSDGMSWLDFTVTDARGHLMTPSGREGGERPIVISAGQSHQHKVTINRHYPMFTTGSYRVRANVSFPQINRVFQTRTVTVQVTDGQPLWSQIVGVPQDHPDAGRHREFSLLTYYHGARNRTLYFRMRDSDTGVVYRTFPIGDYLMVRKPVYTVDRRNHLHVLHMSGPHRYTYTVIDVDGHPAVRTNYYERGSNRPELKTNDVGEVSVVGGITQEEATSPYEQVQFRRISERPPGLPNF